MTKKIITLFFLTIGLFSFAQTEKVKELADLFNSGSIEQAISRSEEYLQDEPQNLDYLIVLGMAYAENREYEKAIPSLEYIVENDKENSWRKGWALAYLGTCYYMLSDIERSQRSIDSCLRLNATKKSYEFAKVTKALLGYGKFYDDWKIRKSEHFIFHFQGILDSETQSFVQKRETAYIAINEFFNSKLPKRIDYYVWNSRAKANRALKTRHGFARPAYCIVHSFYRQTIGHEMTHIISYYSTKVTNKTGLINEGIAVYFDMSKNNYEQIVLDWVKKKNKKIDIKVIWSDWESYPYKLTYPLSGLFVKELIDEFGKEKFLDFFKDQSYENAKYVFGDKLDVLIEEFEKKVNG